MKNKNNLKNKLIVITRPEPDNVVFKELLESHRAQVYLFPTIKIVGVEDIAPVNEIADYDWIIFTSVNGADFFMKAIETLHIDKKILQNKKIAAVGPKTAQRIKEYGLHVDFIPTKFTTEQLAKELVTIQNQKIFLARSDIGSKKFTQDLQNKGAIVTDYAIYTTIFVEESDNRFDELVKNNGIDYITFTSPSTVKGFLARVKQSENYDKILTIPILSIGPVTTKAAERLGFKNIITADEYTMDGMIKKLLDASY